MKKILLVFMLLSVFFVACKKDVNTAPLTQNDNFTQNINSDLVFPNSEIIKGTPPIPDSTQSKFYLISKNDTILSYKGGKVNLFINFYDSENEVKGLYLQINNENKYRKIELNSLVLNNQTKSTNTKKTTTYTLPIEIPLTFEENDFCISYCLFDVKGNVSNVINKCIYIKKLVVNPSLVKEWELIELKKTLIDTSLVYLIPGKVSQKPSTINCNGTKELETYTELNYYNLLLKSDGSYSKKWKYSYKVISRLYEQNGCQIDYRIDTYDYFQNGFWTYNSTDSSLLLIPETFFANNLVIENYNKLYTVSKLKTGVLTLIADDLTYTLE